MKTYTADEFVRKMAAEKGYTIKDTYIILRDLEDTIIKIVEAGDCVHLQGFAEFGIRKMSSKRIEKVLTREEVVIPEHYRVKMVPGARLRRAVARYEVDKKAEE